MNINALNTEVSTPIVLKNQIRSDYQSIEIQKIMVSVGACGKTPKEVEDLKNHFEKIFRAYLLKPNSTKGKAQECILTKCKTPNALWKLRKGAITGFKVTIRARLSELSKRLIPQLDIEKSHFMNNVLFKGIESHRVLRLQRYDHLAPEYGFRVLFFFKKPGSRVKTRKWNPLKLDSTIERTQCLEVLKNIVAK